VNENTEVGTVSGLSKDFYSLKTKWQNAVQNPSFL
jgi:hypothetical protein